MFTSGKFHGAKSRLDAVDAEGWDGGDKIKESIHRYDGMALMENCLSRIFLAPLSSHEYIRNYCIYKYMKQSEADRDI